MALWQKDGGQDPPPSDLNTQGSDRGTLTETPEFGRGRGSGARISRRPAKEAEATQLSPHCTLAGTEQSLLIQENSCY